MSRLILSPLSDESTTAINWNRLAKRWADHLDIHFFLAAADLDDLRLELGDDATVEFVEAEMRRGRFSCWRK